MRLPRLSDRRTLAALGGLALGCLAACSSDLGAPDPATEQGESVVDLWRALLVTATALAVLVLGLVGFALVRYRTRRGDDGFPRQSHGNGTVEAVYLAVPLAIVAGFFAYTLWIDDVVNDAGEPDVVLDVTAYRWGWRFEYPDGGPVIASIAGERPEIVLPVGATVRFELHSNDVIHSFFVPGFVTKRDVIPGRDTHLDVDLTRTGELAGHCAEFCGLDHARMNFTIAVVEPDEYEQWLVDPQVVPA